MTITIDLAPEVEARLRKKAEERGQQPDEYIKEIVEQTVHAGGLERSPSTQVVAEPHEREETKTLAESLEGLVGVFDSSKEPRPERRQSAFDEILKEKYRKQGLKL